MILVELEGECGMKRLDIDEWDEIFCNMKHKDGYSHWDSIKVVWVN